MRFRNVGPVIVLAILAFGALSAGAALVVPVPVPGNPTCADTGHGGFAFKIDPPVAGTYAIDAVNTITVTFSDDGRVLDWVSTLPLDKVIVKGGDAANVYTYVPEATSDSGLVSPVKGDGIPQISHVEICYDYEVVVTKTAIPTYTRTIGWTIAKAAAPDRIDMFTGDSATVDYTVTVDKTVVDSNFAVAGTITIANPSPLTAQIASVADLLSDGTVAAVDCPATSIPAGATMVCTYAASLAGAASLTNTATVTTTGDVGGGTGTAPVVFGAPTTVDGYETVTVTDTNGMTWPLVGNDATFTYARTFTCDGDAGANGNTATIAETGASADASVTVVCHELVVTKTAGTELDRTWSWTIEKTVATPTLTLSRGQVFEATYTVALGAVPADSGWAGSGTITVANPAPIPATLAGVSDVFTGGTATVDCGVSFPYVLAAGGSLSCTWSAGLPDDEPRINTATATLRNTPSGTTSFSGTALVDFSGAVVHPFDDCVALGDSYENAGLPPTACIADGLTRTFTYTRPIGPYDACDTYTVDNVASLETEDSGARLEDDALVTVNVVGCEDLGCTLTPGYWKTHSGYGPAPYDGTWAEIGEDTTFYLSGQSYYQVLWTAPAGNAYYILAHAFIATQLNGLNDATVTEDVQDAFDAAAEIFADYSPADIAALKGKNATQLRAEILGYAYILDQYNNGLAAGGPPHCSE